MKTLLLCLVTLLSAPAFAATPDFYLCTGKVGGEWNFGRAPNGCNGSSFGSDSVIKNDYGPLVFLDAQNRSSERARYMEELHSVIRDAAEYYFKKRKPTATSAEVEAFKLGILTTAAQESYWSHYRFASDNRYKMMRGDVGHGHGFMQVDDRAHFDAIQKGLGWNLLGHLAYAMDIFYSRWQGAPNQPCVSSSTNWVQRTRTAWAAYNGGAGSYCRWTNPNSAWAANDKGFYNNLTGKRWQPYVANSAKPASINVPCLIEKRENCPAPGQPTSPTLRENVLYRNAAGQPCVLKNATLQCMQEFRDGVCLRAVSAFTNATAEVVTEAALQGFPKQVLDRHTTCRAFDPSLLKVGVFVEANTAVNLRATPGGALVGLMRDGEVSELLDFEIRNLTTRDRYYKVKVGTVTGWAYSGDSGDFSRWIVASSRNSPLPPVIARVGEKLQIVNAAGVNLRATAGGNLLLNVPRGVQVTVLDYLIRGADSDVYYKVTYNGKTGFLYSGTLLPRDTTGSWTKRIQ